MIEYAKSKLMSVIEACSRYWQWITCEYLGDDTCFWLPKVLSFQYHCIFLYFQFWTGSDSVEISLALWHHWLTTFPNPWTPLCAFITYHPWTLQVYWIFSTETMRQFSPLLLFGFCGIIWGWIWPSVPKYRNLFIFWHRLGFKLAVLGWSSMPPGQRTGRTGISSLWVHTEMFCILAEVAQ